MVRSCKSLSMCPDNSRFADRKESFLHNYEPSCDPVPPKLTEAQRALLHENLWPEGDSNFKDACFLYDSRMVVLMRKMIQMFALGLGLDEHYFDNKVTHPLASCKMIHYPPQDPSLRDETGIGAHTDFVCMFSLDTVVLHHPHHCSS